MKKVDFVQRTHTCGELTSGSAGEKVVLNGWVQRRRDLGGLIFIDLRDRWGITQVVFNPKNDPELFKGAEKLRNEFVLSVSGTVRKRPGDAINPRLSTGEIEVEAESFEILSPAKTPPFVVSDKVNLDESLRLKYRYIDLRREKMLGNFTLRHKFTKAIRDFLDEKEFLEVETPMLILSTPEGARDYLVPSRVHPGKFYALPQSPQILKQLLMVSGFERYFQVARCFRDEDLRADRQPEFTQIDIEMSFVKQEDVLKLVEDMMAYCFKNVLGKELNTPFRRMSWRQAQDRYGTDKPDTRFGMEIIDVTDLIMPTSFKVVESIVEKGGVIRGIKIPGGGSYSRKQVDQLVDFVKKFGARGLLTVALKPAGWKSPLSSHLSKQQKKAIERAFDASEGDLLALMAGDVSFIGPILGKLRLKMGKQLDLIEKNKNDFLWVTEFPLFKYDAEEDKLDLEHHPFTSPLPEDVGLLDSDILKVRACAYDLVFNGNEVGSGSIRIHDRLLQEMIFESIGISREEANRRFGFLLNAFEYGVPPHGGIALGYDRIIAELCGEESIREVIVFPKNSSGQCLLTGAPVEVEQEQLDVLGLELKKPEKEE